MKKTCNCGALEIDQNSDHVTVHCTKCGYYHTYRGIPKRLVVAVEELKQLIAKWRKRDGSKGEVRVSGG